ncbi:DUF6083 domain-containing protein [Streptomyces sp. NPDC085524]|uniref:DUF6083 domain-containing protein n=1 Tax=unclassified Streptomyces TaxID=2593676 RepID=UPI0036B3CEC5
MDTNTRRQEHRERGENGPFLLAKVLADALVTVVRQPQPQPSPSPSEQSAPQQVPPSAAQEGRSAVCRLCGEAAYWHRTVRGKWLLVQPGERPCHLVPAGQRWRIAGDGTAVNLGAALPSDTCRVSHFDVCPGRRTDDAATGCG